MQSDVDFVCKGYSREAMLLPRKTNVCITYSGPGYTSRSLGSGNSYHLPLSTHAGTERTNEPNMYVGFKKTRTVYGIWEQIWTDDVTGRPRRKFCENIIMDLRKLACLNVNRFQVTQERVHCLTVTRISVQNKRKFQESYVFINSLLYGVFKINY